MTNKIDRKLTEKWVAALRSGDYRQGMGMLKSGTQDMQYCCLGVLCDVMGLHSRPRLCASTAWDYLHTDGAAVVRSLTFALPDSGHLESFGGFFGSVRLSDMVDVDKYQDRLREAIGVGYVRESRITGRTSLMALNDYGVTFGGIADILELILQIQDEEQETEGTE